jgi:hypothetical protein
MNKWLIAALAFAIAFAVSFTLATSFGADFTPVPNAPQKQVQTFHHLQKEAQGCGPPGCCAHHSCLGERDPTCEHGCCTCAAR